jgi:hypothetical protein
MHEPSDVAAKYAALTAQHGDLVLQFSAVDS